MDGAEKRMRTRRGVLGLLAAGGLAGCLGGDGTPIATRTEPTTTETPTPPTTDGGTDAGTSPAGSCAADFGDTDERYKPGDRDLVATFSYPMGGMVSAETVEGDTYETVVSYPAADSADNRHLIRTFQRGPVDYDVVEEYSSKTAWEKGETVSYGGTERPVVVFPSDAAPVWVFGVEEPDGTYELMTKLLTGRGYEPCEDAYPAICERVARSFEPL